jgi:hypothetical protein
MKKKYFPASFTLLPLLSVFVFGMCQSPVDSDKKKNDNTSGNEVVVAWNNMAYTIANQYDQFFSLIGVRALAMTHIAIHDALNAIKAKYESYLFKEKEPDADPVAASSQAAYEVLAAIYPKRQDTLIKELDRWLSGINEGKAKELGIALGKKTALAILNLRKNDGHTANASYKPVDKPGAYQYTPGVKAVWRPDLSVVRSFTLKSVDQFRSPAPPALSSKVYADDYNEVKAFGVLNSSARNSDQTNYAHWWAEFGEHSWNRIGRITSTQRKLPLWETARLFTLINLFLFDLYPACMDSKYAYNTWRPYTAIHNADKDGNPSTSADTLWQPEMQTPPFPEYPSGHSATGAGAAEIVSFVYGTPAIAFQMESITSLPGAKMRSYNNLDSAANDCAASRIMNGFHFRFSTEEGKNQGRRLAKYICSNYLRPVAEPGN